MKPARLEIAPPGGNPTFVVRAPFAVAPESKRGPKMEATERDLAGELLSLEEGTKKRNLQFYAALAGIEAHGRRWEVRGRVVPSCRRFEQLPKKFNDTSTHTCIHKL
jgi:hypothetical protein